jgi:hypothetical protein
LSKSDPKPDSKPAKTSEKTSQNLSQNLTKPPKTCLIFFCAKRLLNRIYMLFSGLEVGKANQIDCAIDRKKVHEQFTSRF